MSDKPDVLTGAARGIELPRIVAGTDRRLRQLTDAGPIPGVLFVHLTKGYVAQWVGDHWETIGERVIGMPAFSDKDVAASPSGTGFLGSNPAQGGFGGSGSGGGGTSPAPRGANDPTAGAPMGSGGTLVGGSGVVLLGANVAGNIVMPQAPTPGNKLVLGWWARSATTDAPLPTGFTSTVRFDDTGGGGALQRVGLAERVVQAGDPASWSTPGPGSPSRKYVMTEWSGLGSVRATFTELQLANTYPITVGGLDAKPGPGLGAGTRFVIFTSGTDIAGRECHLVFPESTLINEGPCEAVGNGPYGTYGVRTGDNTLFATALNNAFQDIVTVGVLY